jgi:hypothetical protein
VATETANSNEHKLIAGSVLVANPEKREGNHMSFSKTDWRYAVAFLGITLIIDHAFNLGRIFAIVMILIWALTGLSRRSYGRPYLVLWQDCQSLWIRHKKKGKLYQSQATDPSLNGSRPKHQPKPPIPLQLTELGEGGIGLVYNTKRKEDSLVIVGRGSDFATLEPIQQRQKLNQLVEVAKRVASAYDEYAIGRSLVYTKRPENIPWREHAIATHYHPDVVVPEALLKREEEWTEADRLDMFLYQINQQALDICQSYGREVTMAAVWTIKRRWLPTDVVRGKRDLAEDESNRAPITQIAEIASNGLEYCRVADPKVLDKEGLKAYVRGALDVAHIEDFYRWQARLPGDPLVSVLPAHWPEKQIDVGRTWCRTDDTYHTVLPVLRSPPRVAPNYFAQLFAAQVANMSIAQVGDTIKYGREYQAMKRWIPIYHKTRIGMAGIDYNDPKARKKTSSMEQRLEDIFESGFTEAYNVLIGVHHTSLKGLEEAVSAIRLEATVLGISLGRVTGESRQLPALISATTGIPMQ